MKYLLTLAILVILSTGCYADSNGKNDLKEEDNNHTQDSTIDPSQQDSLPDHQSHFEQEVIQLTKEMNLLKTELRKIEQERNYLDQVAKDITSMEEVTFDILSEGTNDNPKETVVLVHNVIENKREEIVIKAAIYFSDPAHEQVSLWKDRESALIYIEGDYDPLETHTGWPGFDSMIGFIDNSVDDPTLTLYLGRDDLLELNFGKYVKDY